MRSDAGTAGVEIKLVSSLSYTHTYTNHSECYICYISYGIWSRNVLYCTSSSKWGLWQVFRSRELYTTCKCHCFNCWDLPRDVLLFCLNLEHMQLHTVKHAQNKAWELKLSLLWAFLNTKPAEISHVKCWVIWKWGLRHSDHVNNANPGITGTFSRCNYITKHLGITIITDCAWRFSIILPHPY